MIKNPFISFNATLCSAIETETETAIKLMYAFVTINQYSGN